jgi:Pyridine nucleotide-disulphide oxidoreductase
MSLSEALGSFPSELRNSFETAYQEGGAMAAAMMSRGDMPMDRALVSGLALDPTGRYFMDEALEGYARIFDDLPREADEVIIGGGAHAAIYAAVRRQRYNIKTLVLNRGRFGGTFAMTRLSSFFLNSRNRPGPAGVPGSRDALNVIPGAMMQPSDIGGSEYQANADLGLVVRMTLALNADVYEAEVGFVAQNGPRWIVNTNRGTVAAKRVVMATGIGKENSFESAPFDEKRVFSYSQFMARFDREVFPLRGLGRVAVVGGGDSGKTVVEALTGYGPLTRGSVASLDYVPQIDWYGIEPGMSKERWLLCNRTRYKPLAALFPDGRTSNARIKGFGKAQDVFRTYDAVQIDGRPYDTVIVCTGFDKGVSWRKMVGFEAPDDLIANPFQPVGSQVSIGRATPDRDVIVIGPATRLDFEEVGDPEPRLPENKVALFRFAPRTATMAAILPPA